MKTYLSEGLKKIASKKQEHEFVVRSLAPRTHIISNLKKLQAEKPLQRQSNLETFQNFVKISLPKMEQSIEIGLIQNVLKTIENDHAREYIIQAYEKRQIDIKVSALSSEQHLKIEDIQSSKIRKTFNVETPVKLTLQDEDDIGKFTSFDNTMIPQWYPAGFLGDYSNNQFKYTSRFALQTTETSLKLITELQKIKPIKNLNYSKFSNAKSESEVELLLEDQEFFNQIFHDFSITLIDVYRKEYRNSQLFERLFANSLTFDFLINLMIRQMKDLSFLPQLVNKDKRYSVFYQIMQQIQQSLNQDYAYATNLKNFFQDVQQFDIAYDNDKQILIDLKDYEKKMFKVPKNMKQFGLKDFLGFNSGVLLHGDQGAGKSALMMQCAQFAYENNWIVVQVPNCKDLIEKPCVVQRENFCGLYSQHEFAQEFLLDKIPVNMDIYGFYSCTGQHKNDVIAAPNIYDEERKVYFNEFETLYYPKEQDYMNESDRKMKFWTLKIKLSEPTSIMDIVDKGILEQKLATCAVYELMEQLYNIESHCVMILVDQYNYLFKNSIHKSFRYANKNDCFIPPYHLSLCRAFLKFDGHLIKNGVKICASSVQHLHKHEFEPKHIMLPEKGYNIKMTGQSIDDFRDFMEYLYQNKIWHANDFDTDFHQLFWMECQGNVGQAMKALNFHLRELGW